MFVLPIGGSRGRNSVALKKTPSIAFPFVAINWLSISISGGRDVVIQGA